MPKTLLLADDSVTIQKVVGITFANEDVELVTVDNGDDAFTRARELRPDLVLADVAMPGLTGYELCAAIRADRDLAEIPVLLLTGTFETYDAQRASECGADGYIAKPFEAQALIERVRGLLDRPRAPRAKPAPEEAPAAVPAPQTAGVRAAPPAAAPAGRPHGPPQPRPTAPAAPSGPQGPARTPAPSAAPGGAPARPAPPATSPAFGPARPAAATAPPGAPARPAAPAPAAGAPARPATPPVGAPSRPAPPATPPPGAPARPVPPATAPAGAPGRPAAPTQPSPAPVRPQSPAQAPARPPTPPAAPHAAPASLTLPPTPAPARSLPPSTPAEDALDEIPEEPLTVHTPPRGLHPEGVPRGATATRVMPPGGLTDDALFDEPDEDTSPTARDREALAGEEGEFEIERPVRFDDPESPPLGVPSLRELGQSFSISRDTVTEPTPEVTPPAPPPSRAAPREGAARVDDESDLPWAEPIELDQESDADSGDDSIEAAKFAERVPPPPAPAARLPAPGDETPPVHATPARRAPAAPPLDPRALHESLEKVAWEAFGPLSEQIMQEVVKRAEAIAWEVVPQLAERLIREEIALLKKSDS